MGFTGDGEYLAAVSDDESLRFIKIETEKVVNTLIPTGPHSRGQIISPDGLLFAFADQIWDSGTKKSLQKVKMQPDSTLRCFSPDCKLFAATTVVNESSPKRVVVRSGILALWDVQTGQALATMKFWNPEHASTIFSVAFAPSGKHVAVGTADFRIVLVDVAQLLRQSK